jgi:hypothetical protein
VLGPVRDAHAENRGVELDRPVDVDGVEHDVGDPDGDGLVAGQRDHRLHVRGQLDQAPLRVREVQPVAAADLVEGAGLAQHRHSALVQPPRRLVDLGRGADCKGDPAEAVALGPAQLQDVVVRAGTAQPGVVAVLLDDRQPPDLGVEVAGLRQGRDPQLHRAQRVQSGDRLVHAYLTLFGA